MSLPSTITAFVTLIKSVSNDGNADGTLSGDQESQFDSHLSTLTRGLDQAFEGDLKALFSEEQKQTILRYGTSSLLASNVSASLQPKWITLLKILARTRVGLESTIFSAPFILYLTSNISKFAASADLTSIQILSQSLRLLLNLCVVNKSHIHKAMGVDQPTSGSLFGGSSKIVVAWDESKPDNLTPLVLAFGQLQNSSAEPDAIWLLTRIFLFFMIEPQIASRAIEAGRFYESLVDLFLWASSGEKLGLELRDSSSNPSSSSSSAVSSSSHGIAGTKDSNLKLTSEILKLLTNVSLLDSPSVPSMHAHLVDTNKQPELYDRYLQHLTAILACGVEIPSECLEGYQGDPEANAKIGTLMPILSPAQTEADAAAVQLDQVQLNENSEQKSDRPTTPTSTAASASVSASFQGAQGSQLNSAPSQTPANFTPVQRQQTKIVIAKMKSENRNDDPAAALTVLDTSPSLVQLQRDICNIMLENEGLKAVALLEQDGCKAFHSLMMLLHRSLILCANSAQNKREAESILSPIFTVLSQVIKASQVLREHAKRCIFLDLANPPALVNGKPYKKADASNYSMTPAGAVSEKITDPDPQSLKSLLLTWIITLNFNLKQNVSEFLYRVCNEDTSEYIRLLGFGNAVGLLAEKGLPGFMGLKQSAVNVDDVLKSGKKL